MTGGPRARAALMALALPGLLFAPAARAQPAAVPDAGAASTAAAGTAAAPEAPRASAPSAGAAGASARATARTLHAQGLASLKAGHADEAERLLQRALEKDPENAGIATDLGYVQGKLGRRAEAEATLRAAIARDPRRYYAYVNLADLLADDPSRWERRDQVIAFLDKGLDALKSDDKGRLLLQLRLANFERVVGRTAAARARLQPLLSEAGAAGAPPLARAQRKRALDLLEAIALDERAQALEDWPTPAPSAAQNQDAAAAERALDAGRAGEAQDGLDRLLRRAPSWPRARFLRARALESLGRVDEAVRDLEIAVNLAPSDAASWRALGRLLATHGGALEAARADEALHNALILEPSWDDLRALRARLARRRAALAPAPAAPHAGGASEHARALYREAEEWIEVGDPGGLGRDLVLQALAESPTYVEAAVTAYALTGQVGSDTVTGLWDDGPALWALAAGVRRLGKEGVSDTLTPPWIDRAVALDVQEARFARALARAGAGDRAGAVADLVAYVAREPQPAHLAEARALRAGLAGAEGQPAPELLARIRLLEDRADVALSALGGTCTAERPADRLRAMGLVHEYAEQRAAAHHCYTLAAAAGDAPALARLARLDARLSDAELGRVDRAPLERAAARGVAAAHWALARLASADGQPALALAGAERALALAAAAGDADGWVPAARAAHDGWAAARQAEERSERERRLRLEVAAVALALLLAAVIARRRWRGRTVASALRRSPSLFPEVGRAVAEIRHDVLKHRAGVLGLVADPAASRADLCRALTEPQPTSAVVAGVYGRLAQAARGQGMTLRPLGREPVFGPLTRDLARAEALLRRSRADAGARADDAALLAIDGQLRGTHADRLGALLELGPRTRLDAGEVGSWIGAVEASTRRAGGGWAAPALMLGELAVDFPVERGALNAIFTNLLRNAQAAVAGRDDGRVIVRVDRERDVTGRQVARLLVGDSAAAELTLEAIEARESGRGLAIVRDLVRQWRGHMLVRPESPPFHKQVGACFPV
ncbi:MAG TPA: tetratricopeptide repeat protein [Polyangia bacterium]|nr:tetratricopeptide repeat protein [Polyangia bacterium]